MSNVDPGVLQAEIRSLRRRAFIQGCAIGLGAAVILLIAGIVGSAIFVSNQWSGVVQSTSANANATQTVLSGNYAATASAANASQNSTATAQSAQFGATIAAQQTSAAGLGQEYSTTRDKANSLEATVTAQAPIVNPVGTIVPAVQTLSTFLGTRTPAASSSTGTASPSATTATPAKGETPAPPTATHTVVATPGPGTPTVTGPTY